MSTLLADRRKPNLFDERRTIRGFLVPNPQAQQARFGMSRRAVVDQFRFSCVQNGGFELLGYAGLAEVLCGNARRAKQPGFELVQGKERNEARIV